MCGITGICGLPDQELIKTMCRSLIHRGPDEEGYFSDADVSLGMRRLKVIDLNTGQQPIFNEDESVAVVYNGEIYNYRETRDFLKGKGHRLTTQSDTETIVHLYEEFGDDCVEKLHGMFAFALWDRKRKRLLIARDRLGIKPLYYCVHNGVLVFGSEIKSLLRHPLVSREINFEALHDYLTFMYVPAPLTIFQKIKKLPPGHLLVHEKGAITIRKFWDIPRANADSSRSQPDQHELKERLYSLLRAAVKSHLISDVPLGMFLSGGLDSASLVVLASEFLGTSLKTFSIGFEDDEYNELDRARLIARRYGTDHHEFILRPPPQDLVEEIIAAFDEPFADSSAIPTYYVSKCAKEHVTVALSGDGGDEIFGGYGNYKVDKIAHWFNKIPGFFRHRAIPSLLRHLPQGKGGRSLDQQAQKLLAMAQLSPELGHVFWLSVFSNGIKQELYRNTHLQALLSIDSLERYKPFFDNMQEEDFLNLCIKVDAKTVLPDDYLQKVDRMSMVHSLEVRVPLLDHSLVEFALRIPSRWKIRGLRTKYLLRQIMKDKLPEEVLNGRKSGFSIPLTRWLRQDFSKIAGRYLSKEIVERRGYFHYPPIARLLGEHAAGKKDHSKHLWTLICFEIWNQRTIN